MNIATKITITRILLIPFFIASVLYSKLDIALIVFLIAVLSDAIDGYIARIFQQKTKLGAILDPIADKLFIISAFLCLVSIRHLPDAVRFPPYVLIIVISRDSIIFLGTVIIYMLKGDVYINPTFLGKLTTVLQMLVIILALLQIKNLIFLWNVMIALTVISGLQYVYRGSKVLNER